MRIIWSEIAQATFVRFMADQAGMMAVNHAVEALANDPAPLGAFVRGAYRRLRVGPYRVLYEVEGNLITIVRIDRVQAVGHRLKQLAEGELAAPGDSDGVGHVVRFIEVPCGRAR